MLCNQPRFFIDFCTTGFAYSMWNEMWVGVVLVLINIHSLPAPLHLFSSRKYILCNKGPLRKHKRDFFAILYT